MLKEVGGEQRGGVVLGAGAPAGVGRVGPEMKWARLI